MNILKKLSLFLFILFIFSNAESAKWWDVYFTTQSGATNSTFENAIADYVSDANTSLKISAYTWGNSSHNQMILSVDERARAGVDVKFEADGEYVDDLQWFITNGYLTNSVSIKDDGSNQDLVHSKYIIRDDGTSNAAVLTGSANFTEGGFDDQDNDILLVYNQQVADKYAEEFNEIWNGGFHNYSTPTTNNTFSINGHSVSVYFAGEDEPPETVLPGLITGASHSVFFLSFNHQLSELGDAAVTAKNNNVLVEGVYQSMYSSIKSTYLNNGIDIRQKGSGGAHMHHKCYIIDLETVATGGVNHSNTASSYTDDNMIVVNDFRLGREYAKQFRKLMNQISAQVATPTFETSAPSAISGVFAKDTPNDQGHSITVQWNASSASDFDRYYIYVSTSSFSNVENMKPEAQIKVQNTTEYELTTYNEDDQLPNNTDLWVAVTAVDKHGNENYSVSSYGAVQALDVITGAVPSGSINFASGASDFAGLPSTVEISIENKSYAIANIHQLKFFMGAAGSNNSFTLQSISNQSAPANWSVSSVSGEYITFTSNGTAYDIVPGDSLTFQIAVINPTSSGQSNNVKLDSTDSLGGQQTDIIVGNLIIGAQSMIPSTNIYFKSSNDSKAGEYSNITANISNASNATAGIKNIQIDFSNTSFSVRGSSFQSPPSGWSISSITNSSINLKANSSSDYIDPGENLDFDISVLNPNKEGIAGTITITITDENSNQATKYDTDVIIYASDKIIFNEIMYHPPADDSDYEYLEIFNKNQNSNIYIDSWVLTTGSSSFTIPVNTLVPANSYLVIANDLLDSDNDSKSFELLYGNADGIWQVSQDGFYAIDIDFLLSNTSESLKLSSSDSSYSTSVTYAENSWGFGADGTGYSFEKKDVSIDDTNDPATDANNWGASLTSNGTPGKDNTVGSVRVSSTSATDGTNTASSLDGNERLQDKDITINLTLTSEPSSAPVLYWNVNQTPDGPGGNNDNQITMNDNNDADPLTFAATISSSSSGVSDGNIIEYVFYVDSVLLTKNNDGYKFKIDSSASSVSGLSVTSISPTSVTLSWSPIASMSDFSSYKIYYSTSSGVSTSDNVWDRNNDAGLSSISDTSTTITGLAQNTQYYFNITSEDDIGNLGTLNTLNEVGAKTKQGYNITYISIDDGENFTTNLTGSATLRDHSAVVTFYLDKIPQDTYSVDIYYDVSDTADGSSSNNSTDKKVNTTGVDTGFQGVIPANDAEIIDGVVVNFVIDIENVAYYNSSNNNEPFMYKVDGQNDINITGFDTTSYTGTKISLQWNAVTNLSDFYTYRIYYKVNNDTSDVSVSDNYWDIGNDINLGSITATSTTITGLLPATTYRLNIAVLDTVKNISYLDPGKEITVTTSRKGAIVISEIGLDSNNDTFIEIYCQKGPVDLINLKLSDLDSFDSVITNVSVILSTGEYALIHLKSGTSENSSTGKGSNNIYDFYLPDINSFSPLSDQAVIFDNGDTIDAVCWWSGSSVADYNAGEQADVNNLVSGTDWDNNSINKLIISSNKFQIIRKKASSGLSDNNNRDDWEGMSNSSPGEENTAQIAFYDLASDSINSITDFYIGGTLIDTDINIQITLLYSPIKQTSVKLWFDTSANPDGAKTSNTNDTYILLNNLSGNVYTGYIPYSSPYITSGADLKFIVELEAPTISGVDYPGYLYYYSGSNYGIFSIDDGAPSKLSGLQIIYSTENSVTLSWSKSNDSDFKEYRIYYDTISNVSLNSYTWTSSNDNNLTNIDNVSTSISNLDSNKAYYFAVAAVDKSNQISILSDTVSATTNTSLNVSVDYITDGTNSISDFYSISELQDSVYTVKITLSEVPSDSTTVDLYWDVENVPDGAGGSATDTKIDMIADTGQLIYTCSFSGTEAEIINSSIVQFIVEVDGIVHKNSYGNVWKFKVDSTAGAGAGGLSVNTNIGDSYTTVALFWTPISNNSAYSDFTEYRILYQKGANVNYNDSQWTKVKDTNLSDSQASSTLIKGLSASTQYSVAVIWLDNVSNYSTIAETISFTTNAAPPADDPAFDGINTAHLLNGSEYLQDTDIIITVVFDREPYDENNVYLWYDVGALPDGLLTNNTEDRSLKMYRTAKPLEWSCILPGNDSEIVDEALIQYVPTMDNELKYPSGNTPYKFKIDGNIPSQISGFQILFDFNTSINLTWNTVDFSDFVKYKIYYGTDPLHLDNVWDNTKDSNLSNKTTSNTIISNINPDLNYYFNITAIDKVKYENLLDEPIKVIRNAAGEASQIIKLTEYDTNSIIISGDSVLLKVQIKDNNNNYVTNQNVIFSVIEGNGNFNSDTQINVLTDYAGVAQCYFYTDTDYSMINKVKITVNSVIDTYQISTISSAFDTLIFEISSMNSSTNDSIYINVKALNKDNIIYRAFNEAPYIYIKEDTINYSYTIDKSQNNFVDGKFSFYLSNTEEETISLGFKVNNLDTFSLNFNFYPAAFQIISEPEKDYSIIGESVAVYVYLKDKYNNLVIEDTVINFSLTNDAFSDTNLIYIKDGVGVIKINDNKSENTVFTPIENGLIGISSSISFYSPISSSLEIILNNNNIFAGDTINLEINVLDEFSNINTFENSSVYLDIYSNDTIINTYNYNLNNGSAAIGLYISVAGELNLSFKLNNITNNLKVNSLLAKYTNDTVSLDYNVAKLDIPPDSLGDTAKIIVRADSDINENLPINLLDNQGKVVSNTLREFIALDENNETISTNFSKPIRVYIPYPDEDNNGIVDGTDILEKFLLAYRYNNNSWDTVDDGGTHYVDVVNNYVVVDLIHFSYYILSAPDITFNINDAKSVITDAIKNWGKGADNPLTDLNSDGKVDFEDIIEFGKRYGQ